MILVRVALPASLFARSFTITAPACPGQYTHRSFRRWVSTIDTFQSGLPIHFSFFAASPLNIWGWWHVWSNCHILKQSSGWEGELLPPPLSSWRLRPYGLHGLYRWCSHLAWQWSPTLTGLWWLSHQCTLWGLAVCRRRTTTSIRCAHANKTTLSRPRIILVGSARLRWSSTIISTSNNRRSTACDCRFQPFRYSSRRGYNFCPTCTETLYPNKQG